MMTEFTRENQIEELKTYYNCDDRYKSYLKLALRKHDISKYSLRNKEGENISIYDRAIPDIHLRNRINNLLEQDEITFNEFYSIINELTSDQIAWIGF